MIRYFTVLFAAVLLMSCEQAPCEDCYTYTYSDGSVEWVCVEYDCTDYYSQDLGFTLNAVDTFEGEYANNETLINGEVSDTCDTTWVFNTNGTINISRVLPCVDGPASSGTRQFTSDDDNLYVTMNGYTAPYSYSVESNGDLTLVLLTGDYTITYKLTR